ncbi:prolyl oligopeptidase family serine peptidase [Aliiglaciecola litoralis]|uniref:Peptidase S9 prolyl oligopeptidase catalytic domain-containing protein n=1 Tax=Aliiglaciecola litoralis TaxID=582857 RepID=A0ABN1LQG8_9ALTE
MIIRSIAFLLLSFYSALSLANLVPAEKLFIEANVSMPKLSLDGKYLSNYVNHEGTLYFTITDLEKGQQYIVRGLDNVKRVFDYQWIDNQTLHLSAYQKEYFISLDFTDNQIKSEIKSVRYDGYIVHIFPNSKQVLFAKLRPWDEGGFNLHITDIKTLTGAKLNEKKHLAPPSKNVSFFSYDTKTKRIVASMKDEEQKTILFQYRTLDDPNWQPMLELIDADYEFKVIGFFDDNTLGVLTNKDSDRESFYKFDMAKKEVTELIYEHPRFDLIKAEMYQSDDGVEPLSVTYIDHGRYKIEYLQKSQETIAQKLTEAFEGKQWRILSHSEKTNQYIIYAFDSDYPGAYYLFTPALNKAELLFERYPGLENYNFAKTQVKNLAIDSNINVETYLTKASEHRFNTLLVMPHGGPIGVRETAAFNKEVQYLVSRGFDVLQVNFRGSKGFGKSFKQSGIGELGRAIEKDITLAVNDVLNSHQYKHVCSIGSSYGGYSAIMLAIQQPDTYDCIVARFGIYDLPLLYDSNNVRLHFGETIFDAVLGGNSEELYDVSPVYHAQKIKAPVLLTAGKTDEIAVFEQSRRMEYVLKVLQKPVSSIFYDQTGHGHGSWSGDIHENVSIYDFLVETLNLTIPNSLSTDDKEILAREYELVADGYIFTDTVPNDKVRAKKYYRKSADLGNGKAMNNYAWMLSQSDKNDPDAANMLSWFIKAEEAGFGQASYILAELYQVGKFVEKDLEKAYQKFLNAQRLGFGDKAKFEIARAQCLGLGTAKDFESCLSGLKERDIEIAKEKEKRERTGNKEKEGFEKITAGNDLLQIYGKLFLAGQLSSDEISRLKQQFFYEFQLENSRLDLDIEDFGEYSNFRHLRETTNINSDKADLFGLRFKLRSADLFSGTNENIAFMYTWTIFDENGLEISKIENTFRGRNGIWTITLPTSDVKQTPSKYVINIYDIDKTPLFEESFYIK